MHGFWSHFVAKNGAVGDHDIASHGHHPGRRKPSIQLKVEVFKAMPSAGEIRG
jgi:hypothetical protein